METSLFPVELYKAANHTLCPQCRSRMRELDGLKEGTITYMGFECAEGYLQAKELSEFQNVRFKTIVSPLRPYAACGAYEGRQQQEKVSYISSWQHNSPERLENYGWDIFEQVQPYTRRAAKLATIEDFDIVHAHDWMTYPAVVAVAQASDRPLIVHVHSTEFDRNGEHVNQTIYDIERYGMHEANKVITVSNYTKNIIINRYGITSDKVEVVYNGVESNNGACFQAISNKSDKIVLFLGRITMQKGPEYFIAAAKKVLEKIDNVKFVMAGDGDMTHRMIEYAAYLGIGHKVFFTRFLRGADIDRAYQMADLYVMPSVSEPFGIAPLEAMQRGVPVLISKQSGISENLAVISQNKPTNGEQSYQACATHSSARLRVPQEIQATQKLSR